MPRRPKPVDVSLVVTYRRVSTDEQGDSGAGLDAQETRLAREVAFRGWTRVADFSEVASGKTTAGREQFEKALRMVRDGDAGTLMVSKLDRLCRSVLDFALLTADAGERGWNLVMLEPAVDLSTPTGEMMANIMASVAQWERKMIGQRTSEALRALQAKGVILGRPSGVSPEVVSLIRTSRARGVSYAAIARELNEADVPTSQGGAKWYPSTVRAVELSQAPREEGEDQ